MSRKTFKGFSKNSRATGFLKICRMISNVRLPELRSSKADSETH